MTATISDTNDPKLTSWVETGNAPGDFPIQNLPFGVFRRIGSDGPGRVGVAIGDQIVDIGACRRVGLFSDMADEAAETCEDSLLNSLVALGTEYHSALRRQLSESLRAGSSTKAKVEKCLVPMKAVEMIMPVKVGDFTDFYASMYHATNVGSMFRPDNPLLPNYKHVPIAYHGRSSSIVVSGTSFRRPLGQIKENDSANPVFKASNLLDYELEVGLIVGPGNTMGESIPIGDAAKHIFGLCIVNDWSARDIQTWEYQPLGPFLAKNFATTISPWIVTMEALEPFRTPSFTRAATDPNPLPYLNSPDDKKGGGIDITLEVYLSSQKMRERHANPLLLSRGNFKDMYWTIAQMLTHHTSNGCNLRSGDLLGSGTVSGTSKDSRGCLLELTWRGTEPIQLPTGEQRKFLQDGDEVIMKGYCARSACVPIGFGECRGLVLPAASL